MATTTIITGTQLLQSLRISMDQLAEDQKIFTADISEIKKTLTESAKQITDLVKVVGELNEVILEVKGQISLVGTTKTVKMAAKTPTDISAAAKNASLARQSVTASSLPCISSSGRRSAPAWARAYSPALTRPRNAAADIT